MSVIADLQRSGERVLRLSQQLFHISQSERLDANFDWAFADPFSIFSNTLERLTGNATRKPAEHSRAATHQRFDHLADGDKKQAYSNTDTNTNDRSMSTPKKHAHLVSNPSHFEQVKKLETQAVDHPESVQTQTFLKNTVTHSSKPGRWENERESERGISENDVGSERSGKISALPQPRSLTDQPSTKDYSTHINKTSISHRAKFNESDSAPLEHTLEKEKRKLGESLAGAVDSHTPSGRVETPEMVDGEFYHDTPTRTLLSENPVYENHYAPISPNPGVRMANGASALAAVLRTNIALQSPDIENTAGLPSKLNEQVPVDTTLPQSAGKLSGFTAEDIERLLDKLVERLEFDLVRMYGTSGR